MTRTKSEFNLLKRVGFALLFLGSSAVFAQVQPPSIAEVWNYPSDYHEIGNCMVALSDGSLVFGGHSYVPGDNVANSYLRRVNSSGAEEWFNFYDSGEVSGAFVDMVVSHDGASVVAVGGYGGSTNNGRADLIRLDGEFRYRRLFSGNGIQAVSGIARGSNNKYYCSYGQNFSFGIGIKGVVAVLNDDLEVDTSIYVWDGDESRIILNDIEATPEGFMSIGYRDTFIPTYRPRGVIASANLATDELTYNVIESEDTSAVLTGICMISDSEYVVVGFGGPDEGNGDILTLFVGGEGNINRVVRIPFLGGLINYPKPYLTASGDIIVAYGDHVVYNEIVLVKFAVDGDSLWTFRYFDSSLDFLDFGDLAVRNDGGYSVLCTADQGTHGDVYTRVLRVNPDARDSAAVAADQQVPYTFKIGQNYPNPFNITTRIPISFYQSGDGDLRVFDVLGRTIWQQAAPNIVPGTHIFEFSATGIPTGAYFYEFRFEGHAEARRMVITKQ